jgi:hypothetical protein
MANSSNGAVLAVTLLVTKNGAQISGSQGTNQILASNGIKIITHSSEVTVAAGDTITIQFAGSNTNAFLDATEGIATVKTSATICCSRIA